MRLAKSVLIVGGLAVGLIGCAPSSEEPVTTRSTETTTTASNDMERTSMDSVYDFTMTSIDGNDVPLSEFQGRVALVVNVASKCGFTKQYEGLQKLQETYGDRGFVVLGFPANNFLGQEPGSNEEIMEFCSTRFGVTFPMFAKISVKGSDMHPLYRYLTDEATSEYPGDITWNFNKFLIGPDGAIIGRFDTRTSPTNDKVTKAIEEALAGANVGA